jgi:hypothetical protein
VVGANSTHNSSFQRYPSPQPPLILSQQSLLGAKLCTASTDQSTNTHALTSECGQQNVLEIQHAPIRSQDSAHHHIPARIGCDSVTAYRAVIGNVRQHLVAVAVEPGIQEVERSLAGAHASPV